MSQFTESLQLQDSVQLKKVSNHQLKFVARNNLWQ